MLASSACPPINLTWRRGDEVTSLMGASAPHRVLKEKPFGSLRHRNKTRLLFCLPVVGPKHHRLQRGLTWF